MSAAIGVSLDFYDTLVELDHDVPTIGQALSAKGYRCSPRIEAIWASAGFDGQATHDPAASDYLAWRRSALARLATLCGAPDAAVDDLVDELLALDRTWTVRARPDATVLSDLRALGLPHCILTNWDYPLAPYLAMAGLPADVRAITSAEVGVRKPHAGLFTAARRHLGVTPERHIHVGDDWTADVVGAIRSGAWVIWLSDEVDYSDLPDRIVACRPGMLGETMRALVQRIGP